MNIDKGFTKTASDSLTAFVPACPSSDDTCHVDTILLENYRNLNAMLLQGKKAYFIQKGKCIQNNTSLSSFSDFSK